MTETTVRLGLPVLQPSQAQKHVTHNEALVLLDGITQLVLVGQGRTTPPTLPVPGEVHALSPTPTAAWAGQGGRLAQWVGSHWQFIVPQDGWLAWDLEVAALVVHRAGQWEPAMGTFSQLGIGTSADTTNRLAVASEAALLTHAGAGHQLKINKAGQGDTNSLLFQTDWSGRAEMGCTGSDDFSIKVSSDGAMFHDGLVVEAASGAVRFPNGVAGTGSVAGPLGAQTIALVGERNAGLSVGQRLSFGNGTPDTAGPVLPFDARLVALTLSIAGGPAGETRFDLTRNGVVDPTVSIALDYSGSGAGSGETEVVTFLTAPPVIAAGTALSLVCAASVGASKLVGTLYVMFD